MRQTAAATPIGGSAKPSPGRRRGRPGCDSPDLSVRAVRLRCVGDEASGDGVAEVSFADDIAGEVTFDLEEIDEVIGGLVARHADRQKRDAEIVARRLGVDGEPPESFARIGERFDLARDRVRQLHTRATGQILREAAFTGHPIAEVFARRYPLDARDSQLVRTLLRDTYATGTDPAAAELSYLKIRLAGHPPEDAKRVSGYVMQRIMAWRMKTNRRLAKLRDTEPAAAGDLTALLAGADWPTGSPAPLPTTSTADSDEGGRFYFDKAGRDIGFDSALEAGLLRTVNTATVVEGFRERPLAVPYEIDGDARVHHPTLAAHLGDGRVVLIDVQPLGHIAFHVNRVKSAAARAAAHARGWGWLVWTGSTLGVPDLLARPVADAVADAIPPGTTSWTALTALRGETGFDLLDLAALTLRHEWRWDRSPFRLTT